MKRSGKSFYILPTGADQNSDDDTKGYYTEGILPVQFKKMMNKPETGEKPMPTGENGVVNNYGPRQQVKPGNKQDTENQDGRCPSVGYAEAAGLITGSP